MKDMTLDLSQGVSQVQGQGGRLHPDLRGSQPGPYPDKVKEDKVEVVAEQVVSGDDAAPAKASKEEATVQGPAARHSDSAPSPGRATTRLSAQDPHMCPGGVPLFIRVPLTASKMGTPWIPRM